jgi:Na+/H+-dicarboxylate symporters
MKRPGPSVSNTTQILIGLALGIAVGYLFPSSDAGGVHVAGFAEQIKPLADVFLRMIKMIIAPLLFSTLVVGIAGTGDMKTMGRIGLKAIIYFEVATTIALFLGLALVNIFKPGAGDVAAARRRHQGRRGDGAESAARLGHPAAHVPDLGDRLDGAATSCRW